MNSARVEKSADKLLKIMKKRYKKESAYVLTEKRQRCNMVSFFWKTYQRGIRARTYSFMSDS